MAKVKFAFGSAEAFEKLAAKDPGTIYFVNESGDFSSVSSDTDGDIYLGDKLLTGGGGGGEMPALTTTGGTISPNTLYMIGEPTADVALTLDGGFDTAVANEWHIVFHTGDSVEYGVSVSAPSAISGTTCLLKGSMPLVLQCNKTYEVSVLYAGESGGTAQSGGTRTGGNHVFLLTYKVF